MVNLQCNLVQCCDSKCNRPHKRDGIDVPLEISGYKVVVCDRQGLEQPLWQYRERRNTKSKGKVGDLVTAVLPVNSTQGHHDILVKRKIIVVLSNYDLIRELDTHLSTAVVFQALSIQDHDIFAPRKKLVIIKVYM